MMVISERELDKVLIANLKQVTEFQRIYHYSGCKTAVENIILQHTLKFSDPLKFNDPFDCSEKILKVSYDRGLIDSTLKDLKYNRNQRRKLKTSEIQVQQNANMREEREKYKICCFSRKSDNVLMWSHYSEKHSGICCGFEFPLDNKIFTVAPVRYANSIDKIEGKTELYKVIMYWLTTKSHIWEYEDEYRAILNSKSPHSEFEIVLYDSTFLKEIIFGCNLKTTEIKKILTKLKSNKVDLKNIELRRAQLDPETFNLKINDFEF